jgi:hypothetical protein
MAQSFLNEDELYVPEDIIKEARSVIENLLPRKSVSLYEKRIQYFLCLEEKQKHKRCIRRSPAIVLRRKGKKV